MADWIHNRFLHVDPQIAAPSYCPERQDIAEPDELNNGLATDLLAIIEALQALLRKAELEQDTDFLREGVRVLSQAPMELEVSQHLKAERYEHTPERTGQRNGYRDRSWDTRVGTIICMCLECGMAASSRACLSRVAGLNKR